MICSSPTKIVPRRTGVAQRDRRRLIVAKADGEDVQEGSETDVAEVVSRSEILKPRSAVLGFLLG
jgi:hypothetical protein